MSTKPAAAQYPYEESNGCYNAKDHDSADLCAQWRAAIAAEKAANAARLSNWISAFGAIVSSFGIIALIYTIRQGRDGLERAKEANEIAQSIGVNQTRAYLHIKEVHYEFAGDGNRIANVLLVNSGNSPGEASVKCGFVFHETGPGKNANLDTPRSSYIACNDETFTLGGGIEKTVKFYNLSELEQVNGPFIWATAVEMTYITEFPHLGEKTDTALAVAAFDSMPKKSSKETFAATMYPLKFGPEPNAPTSSELQLSDMVG